MRLWVRLLVIAAGGLMLAKAHTSGPLLALVALVPLLVALRAPTPPREEGEPPGSMPFKHTVLLCAFCYLFSGFQVWPAAQYGWLIFVSGLAYMAAGGALFGAMAHVFLRVERPWLRIAGVTLAWVLADSTRTMTFLSYPMVLGGNLAAFPVLAQTASIWGIWGMDAFVAVFSLLLAEASAIVLGRGDPARWRRGGAWFAAAGGVLAVVLIFGAVRMAVVPVGVAQWEEGAVVEAPKSPRTYALVQGGHPNWFFARATVLERLDEVVREGTLELLDQALAVEPWGRPPDVVIVAENAFGQSLPHGEAGLAEVGVLKRRPPPGTTLLVGATMELEAPDPEHPTALYENALMTLEPDADGELTIKDRVLKRQLVPFAESRYKRGAPHRPLTTRHGAMGVLICYESIYPAITEELVEQGAQELIVVTNDAGLRRSYAAEIHARLGVLRAIESGRPMVHSSQAGLTFLADACGRRTQGLGLFERGVLEGAVTEEAVFTPYSVLGSWWLAASALAWLALLCLAILRMSKKSAP